MAYDLKDKLVITIASSALFDLKESDKIFREQNKEEYEKYQEEHQNVPLGKGIAFSFIEKLLRLNNLLDSDDALVEVILLSRNSVATGERVMNTIEHYDLPITRAVFLSGDYPYPYIEAFDSELFLSGNEDDVKAAIEAGYPAGQVLYNNYETGADKLRIAFDFDGVLADDGAEKIYKEAGITEYQKHERTHAEEPLDAGILEPFLQKIFEIQKREKEHKKLNKNYEPLLEISIVTARNAPAHKRAINTLKAWTIDVEKVFFLGGIEKKRILEILKPDIFFDDQKTHLDNNGTPSVHIPFGIANRE
jgi:5''-nucleotidase.